MVATKQDISYDLSEEDIHNLIQTPFEKKALITKQLSEYYKRGGFTQDQVMAATKIFSALVKDTEVRIRELLSENIKHNPHIPKEIVLELAHDVEEVSLPVLEFSEVLSDEDLINIVQTSENIKKQVAISRRENVSENLSEALIDTNNEEVVNSLIQNQSANISEDSFSVILEKMSENENITESLVLREIIPVSILDNLADKISENMMDKLQSKYANALSEMVQPTDEERVIHDYQVTGIRNKDSEYYKFCKLMDLLDISDEISPLHALCMGNLEVFIRKVARITNTPIFNVKKLINDKSKKGFNSLYVTAKLPEEMIDATKILIDSVKDLNLRYSKFENDRSFADIISKNLIDYISTEHKNTSSANNIDYILSIITYYNENKF